MPHTNIRFDLWPAGWALFGGVSEIDAGAFLDIDAYELEDVISNIDSVSGKRSFGARGIDIQTTIEFVTLAIATGFFAKLGADVYLHLKKRFAKVLNDPIERTKRLGTYRRIDCGIIWLRTSINKTRIEFTCTYGNEDDIYKLIDKANDALKWLNAKIENGNIDTSQEMEINFRYIPRKSALFGDQDYEGRMVYEIRVFKQGHLESSTFWNLL